MTHLKPMVVCVENEKRDKSLKTRREKQRTEDNVSNLANNRRKVKLTKGRGTTEKNLSNNKR